MIHKKSIAWIFSPLLTVALSGIANADAIEPRSGLSTSIVIVRDLELSLDFYSAVLGFEPTKVYVVDKPASTQTLGLDRFGAFQVAYLQPVGSFKSTVDTFALAQPKWVDEDKIEVAQTCEERKTNVATVILSFQVYGLDEIVERAAAKGACIVSPIALSGSGKSRTAGIMDPDGINMELYEYVQEAE